MNIVLLKLNDDNLTQVETSKVIKFTINSDNALLPTKRPLKDFKPFDNITKFNL